MKTVSLSFLLNLQSDITQISDADAIGLHLKRKKKKKLEKFTWLEFYRR